MRRLSSGDCVCGEGKSERAWQPQAVTELDSKLNFVKHIRQSDWLMYEKVLLLCRLSQEMPWEILDPKNEIAAELCMLE